MPDASTARGWCAEARALAVRAQQAEQEQSSSRWSEALQAERRASRDDDDSRGEKRAADRRALGAALRDRRAALDVLRRRVEAVRGGDAAVAAELAARGRDDGDGDDDLGLKGFDSDLAAFRAAMRADFERLRDDERAVARDLERAASRDPPGRSPNGAFELRVWAMVDGS